MGAPICRCAWLVILLSLVLWSCDPKSPGTLGDAVNTDVPDLPASAEIILQEFTVTDSTRSTPPIVVDMAADSRTFRVVMWLPPSSSNTPIMVLAHGVDGSPEWFGYFAQEMASRGIVVAAVAFPLSNAQVGLSIGALGDLENQPGDLSFVFSWLEDEAQNPESSLFERYDTNQLIVLGHSMGAATVLALTRSICCTDTTPIASILISTPTYLMDIAFNETEVLADGPPTLLIHGLSDPGIPSSLSSDLYQAISPPRIFVGLPDTDHTSMMVSPADEPTTSQLVTVDLVDAFIQRQVHGVESSLQELLTELQGSDYTVEYELP